MCLEYEREEGSDTSATLFFVQVNLGKTEGNDEALRILLHRGNEVKENLLSPDQ